MALKVVPTKGNLISTKKQITISCSWNMIY